TNWACALPNFVGFMASDNICPGGNCGNANDLAPVNGKDDGPGWIRANIKGSMEEINYGTRNGLEEGSSPFINSLHPGGFVAGMCDGSVRFITDDVNGVVFSKLITPDGQTMPTAGGTTGSGATGFRQLPLSADQIPGSQ
ncbi:MAG TPA: H-X9-DG-CTERM domain-containing protein, partial [Isosphaeraceae bacterium]|nr:H-X9-DG-CTERM domain-containing protein [Isosphaeraceae bacterium]